MEGRNCSAENRDSVGLLQSSGDHLTQATRDLYETEQTAMRVMHDLDDQRTVMERFRERLQGASWRVQMCSVFCV